MSGACEVCRRKAKMLTPYAKAPGWSGGFVNTNECTGGGIDCYRIGYEREKAAHVAAGASVVALRAALGAIGLAANTYAMGSEEFLRWLRIEGMARDARVASPAPVKP